MKNIPDKSWNPYLTGALIGLLCLFTFYTVDRPMGFARAFAQITVMIENVFIPEHVKTNEFIQRVFPAFARGTGIEWQLMLLIGLFIGAFASSRTSGEFKQSSLPAMWEHRFCSSKAKRWITAYTGGIILFLGLWTAGGCTMGHGINGSMQLALSGWVFFMMVFAAGIITAKIMYRGVK